MVTTSLYVWSELIPNWLMAASAISATAAFLWRRQDRREARELRVEATKNSVDAVWVAATINGTGGKWGILVTNNLPAPIRNLRVECTGNFKANSLEHPALQPGEHFFESLPNGSGRPWALPTSNIESREFITGSTRHSTESVSFDYSGNRY